MKPDGTLFFLKRWIAHPLRMGAILPSSPRLAAEVAQCVLETAADAPVLELGAGTGTITRGLSRAGIPAERLWLVELDADMIAYLRTHFPGHNILQGDASTPLGLIPDGMHGRFGAVISGIPALQFPLERQRRFVEDCFALLRPGGTLVQFTYSLGSPLQYEALHLQARRAATAFANVPPAHVWAYTRDGDN
ncbi:class I SAM-dependent methyltransferase [Arhodomonas sp. AD133]|uniref:class I SAM-dependent methyltransferase n=1 Tax=Arhodomonas sp. AD133 TaxID=3415009 RepID=UPI003EBBB222